MPGWALMPRPKSTMSYIERPATLICIAWSSTSVFIPYPTPSQVHYYSQIIIQHYLLNNTEDDDSKKSQQDHSHCKSLSEVHCKTVASAFWNHQVEAELRERHWEEYLFASSSSREEFVVKIDAKRAKSVYPHDESECSEECKRRG